MQSAAEDLSEDEAQFIRASTARRDQQEAEHAKQAQRERNAERRARRLLAGLTGVMAVAVMLALAFTAFSLAQRRQALEAYSRSLGVSAQKALEDQDGATALAFALAATNAGVPAPVEVQRVLLNAAYAPGAAWRGDANALFAGGGASQPWPCIPTGSVR